MDGGGSEPPDGPKDRGVSAKRGTGGEIQEQSLLIYAQQLIFCTFLPLLPWMLPWGSRCCCP